MAPGSDIGLGSAAVVDDDDMAVDRGDLRCVSHNICRAANGLSDFLLVLLLLLLLLDRVDGDECGGDTAPPSLFASSPAVSGDSTLFITGASLISKGGGEPLCEGEEGEAGLPSV